MVGLNSLPALLKIIEGGKEVKRWEGEGAGVDGNSVEMATSVGRSVRRRGDC